MDPSQPQTVVEQQAEMAEMQKNESLEALKSGPLVSLPPNHTLAQSGAELHERLKSRIEELRAKRFSKSAQAAPSPKPLSRQDIIDKRKQKKLDRKKAIEKKKENRKTIKDTIVCVITFIKSN